MPKKKKIRVRFAPSPTGYLHVGSLRTIMIDYLFARRFKGDFLLRIEDTDQERKVEGAVEALINTLKTLGIEYDEGPFLEDGKIVEKGKFGPYTQSARLDLYKKHAEQLIKEKKAYYCFCSEQRLEEMRKSQEARKMPPMYDRHCLDLTPEEIEEKLKNNEPHVIRLMVPRGETIKFEDLLHGDIEIKGNIVDDQILMKSDGFPTYHLASVVDDHFMEISHVIRGDEWISSAPKHVLLYKAFGWEPPVFVHHSLLLNKEGGKLSKRHGDVAVEDFLKKGYLVEALLNFVGLLIFSVADGADEILSLKQMVKMFDWQKVHKTPAVFNTEKLDWLNGHYIRNLKASELIKRCEPYFVQAGYKLKPAEIKRLTLISKERMKKLSDIVELNKFLLEETLHYDSTLLVWRDAPKEKIKENLNKLFLFLKALDKKEYKVKILEEKIRGFVSQNNLNNGEVLWPMRVALTGLDKSPGPFEVGEVLGKEKVLARLKEAIDKL